MGRDFYFQAQYTEFESVDSKEPNRVNIMVDDCGLEVQTAIKIRSFNDVFTPIPYHCRSHPNVAAILQGDHRYG